MATFQPFPAKFSCNKSPAAYVSEKDGGSARITSGRVSRPTKRMVLSDLIRDVIRTLWAHKLRTFLTMFGIAWGIVSIVLMVAAGEGLRVGQAKVASTFGRDVMIVFAGRTSMQAGGTRAGRLVHWVDSDIQHLQAEATECQYAIPELEQNDVRSHTAFNAAAFTVTGSMPEFSEIRSLGVSEGRFYNGDDINEG